VTAAVISVSGPRQCSTGSAGGEMPGEAILRVGRLHRKAADVSWIEKLPSHRTDFFEEIQGGDCLSAMDGPGKAENPEVDIHLFRGSVGNPPVVDSVSSESPVLLSKRPGLTVDPRSGGIPDAVAAPEC